MQTVQTLNEGLKRSFRITIAGEDLAAEVDRRLVETRPNVRMKGFRKGKVPLPVLRKHAGESVLNEAAQDKIKAAVTEHVANGGERVLGTPRVTVAPRWNPGDGFEFDLSYDVAPEIPDIVFSDITVEKLVVAGLDGLVDEELRARARSFVDKDGAAEMGDRVIVDFVGRIDGEIFEGGEVEDYPLTLGTDVFIPGFDEGLVGLSAGDRSVVHATFPGDHRVERLAGKAAEFEVTVKAVKTGVDGEIDDEFAKRQGADNLEELKTGIRAALSANLDRISRNLVRTRLLGTLQEKVSFECRSHMLDQQVRIVAKALWMERNPTAKEEDVPELEATPEVVTLAERRVRGAMLFEELGRKSGIEISEQDLAREVARRSITLPGSQEENFNKMWEDAGVRTQVNSLLFESRIIDYILELIHVEVREVTLAELNGALSEEGGDG